MGALVGGEAAAVLALLRTEVVEGIDWVHLGAWLRTTPPEPALVAVIGTAALVMACWLLASTALYGLAAATQLPALVRNLRWTTLPSVRRTVDAALATGVTVAVLGSGAISRAQVPAPVVVEVGPAVQGHLYTPTPAGRGQQPGGVGPGQTKPGDVPGNPVRPAAPGQGHSEAALGSEPTFRLHLVVPGDSLWTIAEDALAASSDERAVREYWLRVIDANRSQLRSGDPDLIYPGEVIRRPAMK